ncbi:MAG TPA: hypothetical protein VHV51_07830 [Polyangiaceae bacterium]|nr:hypothetical protein [Polyangiaceae bacterium]
MTRKSAVPVSFKSKPLDSSLTVALHSAAGTGGEDDAALTGCLAREALPH